MRRFPCIGVIALVVCAAAGLANTRADEQRPKAVRLVDVPPVADLDLSDTTLGEAVERLRTLTGANILVRWPALEAAAVYRQSPVRVRLWDVPAEVALTTVLRYVDGRAPAVPLAWQEADGIVTVSTEADLSAGRTKVDDVRDLITAFEAGGRQPTGPAQDGGPEAADQLIRIIMEDVEADSWRENGGTYGLIRLVAGRLAIILQATELPLDFASAWDYFTL